MLSDGEITGETEQDMKITDRENRGIQIKTAHRSVLLITKGM